jgi:hypothetical protein
MRYRARFTEFESEINDSPYYFEYPGDTNYKVWVGRSVSWFNWNVLKISAPYCRTLRNAINQTDLWRNWSSYYRIWEIDLNRPILEQVCDQPLNVKIQSLIENIIYYLDWEFHNAQRIQDLRRLQQQIVQNPKHNNLMTIYGGEIEEFEHGMIRFRENPLPKYQHIRVWIYTHWIYFPELIEAIKSIGYETLHHHFDREMRAWSLSFANDKVLTDFCDLLATSRSLWIKEGMLRLVDWFGNHRYQQIKAFDRRPDGTLDEEAQTWCKVPINKWDYIYL